MPLKLRKADLADFSEILSFANAFHEEDGHPLAKGGPEAIRSLLSGSPLGEIFLLQREGNSVGYFALTFTMSLEFGGLVVILDDFYVVPKARGSGLGQNVLDHVQKIAMERKAVQIFLEVEYANSRAFSFYERNGWKKRERHMMEKKL
jgi:ribosomal protein S18 acetylase RimI-like enzyme